jgi:HD-GYP domain-containing protein (c-di-GMP phosphodiesterase class II)
MFVAELDRPWLDTPFLLQGFLIDADEQIYELRRHCQFVYVDPVRSIGAAYAAPPIDTTGRAQDARARPDDARLTMRSAAPADAEAGVEKESILQDVKTIIAETLRGDGRKARDGGDAESSYTYYDNRTRQPLTDSHVKSPIGKNFSLLSQSAKQGDPVTFLSRGKGKGFFRELWGAFKAPGIKPPKPRNSVNTSAAYGDVELTIYEDVVPVEKELKPAQSTHEKSVQILEQIALDIRKDKVLDIDRVNDAVDGMVQSIVRNPNALIWLTRLKQRDNYAYGHAIDVSIYMIAFGRHLGFPKEQLNHLGISGLLQDVGKIKLPTELLNKTGMLSQKEFETLRAHVAYSLEILRDTDDIPLEVFDTVATHHERYDGSGYPRGLKKDEIGMFGAMAGIVDCFQALISERPYASPVSAHQAMQDLYGWRDKYFSAALIEQFIQCLGIFPVGSVVELNTGDVGIVVSQNKVRKLKPQVLLVLDHQKKRYSTPTLLDLINNPLAHNDKPFEIRRALAPGAHGIDPKEYYL